MKITRKIINIDESLCDGCGLCIPSCHEQAIQLVDTPNGKKARLVKEMFCDGLDACLGTCPTGALTITEREADAFDETATQQHAAQRATDAARRLPVSPHVSMGRDAGNAGRASRSDCRAAFGIAAMAGATASCAAERALFRFNPRAR